MYSNMLTRLHFNLEAHPTLKNNAEARSMLETLFFQVRQVPISASKGKMSLGDDPLQLYTDFKVALQNDNVDLAQSALASIFAGSGRETVMNSAKDVEDARRIFGVETKLGDSVNLKKAAIDSGKAKDYLREFILNRNRDVDKAVASVTRREISAADGLRILEGAGHGPDWLRYASGSSKAAEGSASVLGAINDGLKVAARTMREGFRPGMTSLAVGLGAAAIGGLLSTNISSSKYRPEETAGTSDHVPGQDVEGSMSSRPRARRTAAPFCVEPHAGRYTRRHCQRTPSHVDHVLVQLPELDESG
jgi:hypothetical protein